MVQHRHPSCFSHLTKWCGEQTKRLLVCSLTCADLASAICCPVPSILEAVSKSASLILIATHLKGLEANWCICSHQKRLQQTSVRFSLCRFTCVTENIRKPSLSHWGKCLGLCENLVLSRNAGKNSSFHGEHDWTVYKCVEEDVLTSCPLWNVHFTARFTRPVSHGPFPTAQNKAVSLALDALIISYLSYLLFNTEYHWIKHWRYWSKCLQATICGNPCGQRCNSSQHSGRLAPEVVSQQLLACSGGISSKPEGSRWRHVTPKLLQVDPLWNAANWKPHATLHTVDSYSTTPGYPKHIWNLG